MDLFLKGWRQALSFAVRRLSLYAHTLSFDLTGFDDETLSRPTQSTGKRGECEEDFLL